MKLAAARIFVRRLDEAADFYGRALGLKTKAMSTSLGYVVFDVGGCDLVVEQVPADAAAEDQAMVGRFSGLSFSVPDLVQTCQALSDQGLRFTSPPEAQPWGGQLATLLDPAGNALQLVQYPAA